jgi:cell wall-associated NlpC family hydrolase
MIIYEDLIGTPFEYGGRGPESYDCWGLILEMLNRHQNLSPEDYGWADDFATIQTMMLSAEMQTCWEKTEMQAGALLLFRIGRFVSHVGYAINGRQFIHTWERCNGVVVENLSQDWQKRLTGCYRYVENK